jgi:hypothetical protein
LLELSTTDASCPKGERMGSPSSRWVVSWIQLLLGAVASGLVVRPCMGACVLVVLLVVR